VVSAGEAAGHAPALAGPPQRGEERRSLLASVPPRGAPGANEERRSAPAPIVPVRTPVRTSAPLSAASLAHRVAKPPDEPAVVHVAIGHIEVVANVAPPPAARRGPTPRQPTVALADYLRGEQGGRR